MQAAEWITLTKGLTTAMKSQYTGFSPKKIKALDRAARNGEELVSIPAGKVRAALIGCRPASMRIEAGKIVAASGNAFDLARSRYNMAILGQAQPATLSERLDAAIERMRAWEAIRPRPEVGSKDKDFPEWREETRQRVKSR